MCASLEDIPKGLAARHHLSLEQPASIVQRERRSLNSVRVVGELEDEVLPLLFDESLRGVRISRPGCVSDGIEQRKIRGVPNGLVKSSLVGPEVVFASRSEGEAFSTDPALPSISLN